jgi:hypothetical protein
MRQDSIAPRTLPDALLAEGVTWITTGDVARRLGIQPSQVPDSLERARAAGRMRSITKGAWLVVPPEYLRWGAPPPEHYIDAWMRHLGHPYYVGLWPPLPATASAIMPRRSFTWSRLPASVIAPSAARRSSSCTPLAAGNDRPWSRPSRPASSCCPPSPSRCSTSSPTQPAPADRPTSLRSRRWRSKRSASTSAPW